MPTKPNRSDHLLREAFPLIVHLSHHLRGENAIDETDRLIGEIADRLREVGLMARPRVVPSSRPERT